MLKQNIPHRAPKVPPVGGKGALDVSVDISFLRGLDIVQGDGGVLVVVKRWQQAGLHAYVERLHLRGVKTIIVPA